MKKATLDQASKILSIFEDTPREQIQDLLESGYLAILRDADISRIDRNEVWRVFGPKFLISKEPPLLEYISSIIVPATTERFIARKKFVVNTSHNVPVKIKRINDNFIEWFLVGSGKIEEPFPGNELLRYRLRKDLSHAEIINKFGGEKKVETSLIEVYSYMAYRSPRDGDSRTFYMLDTRGVLRAVLGCGDGDGWDVDAYSVKGPHTGYTGLQVFSHCSPAT